jgi:hypothetical protein
MGRRVIYELKKYTAKKKREHRISALITVIKKTWLKRIAYRRLNYYKTRAKELKQDYILADVLYSEHTIFAKNGDLIPTNSQENINFVTVESRSISHMQTEVIRLVRKEDESEVVRESLKRQAVLISKLKKTGNKDLDELESDNTPSKGYSHIEGPQVTPQAVKFKANVSNDPDEVASQRTYQQQSPTKMDPVFSPKDE